MKKLGIVLLAVLWTLGLYCIVAVLTGVIIMLLWNWLMPDIFGLSAITFLQGWGLSVLSGILFRLRLKFDTKND